MKSLPKEDRLSLMRFVCSFAWADFEIQDEERTLVGKLIAALELDPDEEENLKLFTELLGG